MSLVLAAAVAVLITGWNCGPALANDLSAQRARESDAVCAGIETLPTKQAKLDRLDEGIQLGEAAVAADATDARAHFSLFCNLAKQVELAGLSWRALGRL